MQKIKFFNSGLYNEPSFYKQYEVEHVFDNIDDEIYNRMIEAINDEVIWWEKKY